MSFFRNLFRRKKKVSWDQIVIDPTVSKHETYSPAVQNLNPIPGMRDDLEDRHRLHEMCRTDDNITASKVPDEVKVRPNINLSGERFREFIAKFKFKKKKWTWNDVVIDEIPKVPIDETPKVPDEVKINPSYVDICKTAIKLIKRNIIKYALDHPEFAQHYIDNGSITQESLEKAAFARKKTWKKQMKNFDRRKYVSEGFTKEMTSMILALSLDNPDLFQGYMSLHHTTQKFLAYMAAESAIDNPELAEQYIINGLTTPALIEQEKLARTEERRVHDQIKLEMARGLIVQEKTIDEVRDKLMKQYDIDLDEFQEIYEELMENIRQRQRDLERLAALVERMRQNREQNQDQHLGRLVKQFNYDNTPEPSDNEPVF